MAIITEGVKVEQFLTISREIPGNEVLFALSPPLELGNSRPRINFTAEFISFTVLQ